MTPRSSTTRAQIAATVSDFRKARLGTMRDSISQRQRSSAKVRKVQGPLWVSPVQYSAAGDNNVLRLLRDTTGSLGDEEANHQNYIIPALAEVNCEWVGWRSNASANEPEPQLSEELKYKALMEDVSSPLTILYLFGGNF